MRSPTLFALIAAFFPTSVDPDAFGVRVLDALAAEAAEVGCLPTNGAYGHRHRPAIGQADVERVAGTFNCGTNSSLGHRDSPKAYRRARCGVAESAGRGVRNVLGTGRDLDSGHRCDREPDCASSGWPFPVGVTEDRSAVGGCDVGAVCGPPAARCSCARVHVLELGARVLLGLPFAIVRYGRCAPPAGESGRMVASRGWVLRRALLGRWDVLGAPLRNRRHEPAARSARCFLAANWIPLDCADAAPDRDLPGGADAIATLADDAGWAAVWLGTLSHPPSTGAWRTLFESVTVLLGPLSRIQCHLGWAASSRLPDGVAVGRADLPSDPRRYLGRVGRAKTTESRPWRAPPGAKHARKRSCWSHRR